MNIYGNFEWLNSWLSKQWPQIHETTTNSTLQMITENVTVPIYWIRLKLLLNFGMLPNSADRDQIEMSKYTAKNPNELSNLQKSRRQSEWDEVKEKTTCKSSGSVVKTVCWTKKKEKKIVQSAAHTRVWLCGGRVYGDHIPMLFFLYYHFILLRIVLKVWREIRKGAKFGCFERLLAFSSRATRFSIFKPNSLNFSFLVIYLPEIKISHFEISKLHNILHTRTHDTGIDIKESLQLRRHSSLWYRRRHRWLRQRHNHTWCNIVWWIARTPLVITRCLIVYHTKDHVWLLCCYFF